MTNICKNKTYLTNKNKLYSNNTEIFHEIGNSQFYIS